MAARPMSKQFRWLLFVAGIIALLCAGIYLGTAQFHENALSRMLRAAAFLLFGVFFLLKYGETRGDRGSA